MKIPNQILDIFPEAKFVPSEDFQIEDDSVKLNDELSIQVGSGYYIFTIWNEDEGTMEYRETRKKILDAYNDAIGYYNSKLFGTEKQA